MLKQAGVPDSLLEKLNFTMKSFPPTHPAKICDVRALHADNKLPALARKLVQKGRGHELIPIRWEYKWGEQSERAAQLSALRENFKRLARDAGPPGPHADSTSMRAAMQFIAETLESGKTSNMGLRLLEVDPELFRMPTGPEVINESFLSLFSIIFVFELYLLTMKIKL